MLSFESARSEKAPTTTTPLAISHFAMSSCTLHSSRRLRKPGSKARAVLTEYAAIAAQVAQ
eukprot:342896-Pyramimonas_sp.AAC.1